MPTDRWLRLEQLFSETMAQPAARRAEFLSRACEDPSLRNEIASLVAAAEQSGDFLSASALDVFARQISREGWSVQPGDRIAVYTIERRLGAGGIGEVWRARDERLDRDVAIKLLLPHPSNAAERIRAFQREARAAGTLNHPNVLTVYDVGDHDGAPYIVTECLEGQSLRARLASGALAMDAALDIAVQVARGLRAAHDRGFVHRDLKPENIFLVDDGRVKILDFGLATLLDGTTHAASPRTSSGSAAAGRVVVSGTAGYMAPEQVRGEGVDRRADIFAFGVVLYEMLSGRRPFGGGSAREAIDASLIAEPLILSDFHPEVPRALAETVRRCLAKSPDDRFAAVAGLESALEDIVGERNRPPTVGLRALVLRPRVMTPMVLALVLMAVGFWLWSAAAKRAEWARGIAAPEIARLSNHGDYAEAFVLAREALDAAPDDPHLQQLWLNVSVPARMTTEPSGADVSFAPYRSGTAWFPLGRTPLEGVRIPRSLIRLRVTKPGFQAIEGSGSPGALPNYRLDAEDTVPAGMVRVVSGRDPVRFGAIGELHDFWIDRFEVTNRQFKVFVEQGGYRRREYWREPFIDNHRTLPWAEAILRFRDASGEPGPATWSRGTYADGRADFPVDGVSWYEAAAYAAFAGKSLPTIFHWYRAAALGRFADILTVSNFSAKDSAPVGSHHGVGPFGTYDMAGNVKEWCWNETDGRRFLLGGAWNEARYTFADYDAKGPFERAVGYGFRVAQYLEPPPLAVTAAVVRNRTEHDGRTRQPVGDDVFEVYRRLHAYDRTALNTVIEATHHSDLWTQYTVAFDAAYDGERMRANLFLPAAAAPPYQTVVFFPAADAFQLRSSRDMSLASAELIVRSGRAFLYPVYKGTYERSSDVVPGPNERRDVWRAWSRDLGRAIDFLETRSDIDRNRLAFYGISAGADAGVPLSALESRLKTSILQATGLLHDVPPENDAANFAPRVRIPTLMLNGRYDFESPLDSAQRPLFALLGSPEAHKRHAIIETGHNVAIEDAAREILPWLNRYLGPVTLRP